MGCKACKRECPAGVDMARMKAEVLHLRNRECGVPLRERLFASLPRLAPLAARVPGLCNLRNRSRVLRWAGERALGIAAERELPEWHGRPFRDGELGEGGDGRGGGSRGVTDSVTDSPMNLSANGVAGGGEPRSEGPVTLFVDTFTRYFDPNIARAARDVLRRLGYDPVAARASERPRRPLCCGRTWIAAGLLDQARAELRRTLDALVPLVRRGIPVVGLEPSCLLTLRDEALHLRPAEDARLVAGNAFLADEFLAARFAPTRAPHGTPAGHPGASPAEGAGDAEIRIHSHCHQKAAGTESATADAVSALLPGTVATPIRSSCCGMAGSFGYTAKHQRTSRGMGELGLFPTLRAAPPSDVVVANGFSCRAQIRDGTGRQAQHLVEVLAGRIGV